MACSFDTRLKEKEQEKVERYHEWKREIGRFWQCKKVVVIPIIIGLLGTIGKSFRTWKDTDGELVRPYAESLLIRNG